MNVRSARDLPFGEGETCVNGPRESLWVVSTDFQRSMAEFDTSKVPAPTGSVRQLEWCGNDAIIVTWDSLVVLVGPFGDTLQYVLPNPFFGATKFMQCSGTTRQLLSPSLKWTVFE